MQIRSAIIGGQFEQNTVYPNIIRIWTSCYLHPKTRFCWPFKSSISEMTYLLTSIPRYLPKIRAIFLMIGRLMIYLIRQGRLQTTSIILTSYSPLLLPCIHPQTPTSIELDHNLLCYIIPLKLSDLVILKRLCYIVWVP